MNLPVELILEISSYLGILHIYISFPKVFELDITWEMLFRRDFPCHKHIKDDFYVNYVHLEILKICSQNMQYFTFQQEVLEFISQNFDCDQIDQIHVWLSEGDLEPDILSMIYCHDFREQNPEKANNLIQTVASKNLDKIDELKQKDVIWFKNGEITMRKGDQYSLQLIWLFEQ